MSKTKQLIIGGVIVVIALAVWGFTRAQTSYIDSDTTIQGDYSIKSGKKLVVRKASKLTVEGNFTSDGQISCDGGELQIIVKGSANINNTLACNRSEANSVSGIRLAAGGGLQIGKDAKIESNRSVQLVAKPELFADTPEKIRELYDQAAKDDGAGQRVGPFVPDAAAAPVALASNRSVISTSVAQISSAGSWFAKIASAQAAPPVVIAGKIKVETPPRGIRQVVVFNFPGATGISIENFELEGPDGNDGESDKGVSCTATGKDGEDAMRFLAVAGNIKVNNFTLKLGNGGKGGDAETTKDCDNAVAKGGKGGNSGNFKMVSAGNFDIEGDFVVVPGSSGNGGHAKAYGKDGEGPGAKGGDATSTGGSAADNKKSLKVGGSVGGVGNIQFASIFGGRGGDGESYGGRGGDGKGCKSDGGDGGKATASGGKGGDASLSAAGGSRTPDAEDLGGNGGNVTARPGRGGNGGSCDPKDAGGHGGKGGDANVTKGLRGSGNPAGSEGGVNEQTGGNGGNGGDGCGPGNGGNGGSGNPAGQNGKPGKNLCVEEKKTDSQTSGPSTETKVKVIQYNGKYLPLDQLIIEAEKGCDGGQQHWHAAKGVVKATDGAQVADPGPQCGYGKVKDKPVMEITVK